MNTLPPGEPITVAPIKTFPLIKDLVTDVSFNYEVADEMQAERRELVEGEAKVGA
jgi:succinate dehydrogenase / fumarate reductase iron-sulfur subunit